MPCLLWTDDSLIGVICSFFFQSLYILSHFSLLHMISILCHSRENEARSRKLIVYLASTIRNTRYIDDLFRKKERGKTTLGRDKNMNYLNFAKTHHIIVEACFPNLISLLKHTHSGELLQMPEIRFSLCVSCLTSYVANYRICNDIGMLFHDNNLEKI